MLENVLKLIQKFSSIFFQVICVFLISVSCSTKTCSKDELLQNHPEVSQKKLESMDSQNMKTIKVYKFDGSKQCEKESGISIETMAKELGLIKIISSAKKHDGLMRTQVCGTPTGQCNVYEIFESDYPQAEKLGFKKWKND